MESMAQKAPIAKVEVLIGRINEFRESYTADWRERCYKVIITEIQDIFREYFGIPEGSTIPDGKPKDLAISAYEALMKCVNHTLAASFAKSYEL